MDDTSPGRVLGVDLGLKRTGLAVSDELRLTTRALPNRIPKSRAEDVEFLLGLCEELGVREIVVGYPLLPQSGEEGPMARRARGFSEALAQLAAARGQDVEVHLVDERGTSVEAAHRLAHGSMQRGRRRAALDGEVARLLIEQFVSAIR